MNSRAQAATFVLASLVGLLAGWSIGEISQSKPARQTAEPALAAPRAIITPPSNPQAGSLVLLDGTKSFGDTFVWTSIDPSIQLFPDADGRKVAFATPKQDIFHFVLSVGGGKNQVAVSVVSVNLGKPPGPGPGPIPPVPPAPPTPVDQTLLADLKDAFKADPATDKAEQYTKVAAIFDAAAKQDVYDKKVASCGDLDGRLYEARKRVAERFSLKARQAYQKHMAKTFGEDPAKSIDVVGREKVAQVLLEIARALEECQKP